ncbi:hypothetical protein [Fibrella forsythiae]|uniref:Transmembrane protein 231 n=1 Tax=Fibrella forsythiae TaxID=2817061 RepID=A0ABS3JK58_9BACT|nr:hypothetical protein [Fibrella forsythiae]MBO0950392.1 hypothetical protein [Fibrella forsythiae]
MKKAVSIGLFSLLVYHTLAYVLVCIASWWQAEHDLSQRLQVYRSVDSVVEFQIPLHGKTDGATMARTTEDGFRYRDHYYTVISLEVLDDTLHIASMEVQNQSLWQDDLLMFLTEHVSGSSDHNQKATQFLKFLLKEYSASPRTEFTFVFPYWREVIRIPGWLFMVTSRALPVHLPPPRC